VVLTYIVLVNTGRLCVQLISVYMTLKNPIPLIKTMLRNDKKCKNPCS